MLGHTVNDFDGLQVGRVTVLQGDGDGAVSAGPLNGEGLAGLDVVVAVGQSDLSRGNGGQDGQDGSGELHFVGLKVKRVSKSVEKRVLGLDDGSATGGLHVLRQF